MSPPHALLQLAERWRDGDTTPEESAQLAAALRVGDEQSQVLADYVRLDGFIALALGSTQLPTTTAPAPITRRRGSRRARPATSRRWPLAAALMVVFVIGYVMWPDPQPQVDIIDAFGQRSAARDTDLVLTSGTALAWRDGTRLDIVEGATLRLGAHDHEVALTHGRITATVTPSGAGFRISTPSAMIRVLGTQFSVSCDDKHTTVAVSRGRVQVTGKNAQPFSLDAGESARLSADGQRLPSPFLITDDLAGWTVRRGEWTARDGVLTGRPAGDGAARIETALSFTTLSLRCRLRAVDLRRIEVQVRDYSSWAVISAENLTDGWHDLVFEDRNGVVRATLGGVALSIEPVPGGDRENANSKAVGPFALYVRGSGYLEIRDILIADWMH